jgi:hypothetical protein
VTIDRSPLIEFLKWGLLVAIAYGLQKSNDILPSTPTLPTIDLFPPTAPLGNDGQD